MESVFLTPRPVPLVVSPQWCSPILGPMSSRSNHPAAIDSAAFPPVHCGYAANAALCSISTRQTIRRNCTTWCADAMSFWFLVHPTVPLVGESMRSEPNRSNQTSCTARLPDGVSVDLSQIFPDMHQLLLLVPDGCRPSQDRCSGQDRCLPRCRCTSMPLLMERYKEF